MWRTPLSNVDDLATCVGGTTGGGGGGWVTTEHMGGHTHILYVRVEGFGTIWCHITAWSCSPVTRGLHGVPNCIEQAFHIPAAGHKSLRAQVHV